MGKKVNRSNLSKKIFFIEFLRFIAMANVFISHIFAEGINSFIKNLGLGKTYFDNFFINPFFVGGGFGVSLFFLITGYVITLSCQKENFKQFFIRRVFRIYPSLFLALSAFWILSDNLFNISFKVFVGSTTLLGDLLQVPNQLNGVDWTLRVEIFFYLLVFLYLILNRLMYFKYIYSAFFIPFLLFILIFFPGFLDSTEWNHGYLEIFFPCFIGGITIALYHTKKLSSLFTYISFTSSLVLCYYNLVRLRPDLLMSSTYILYAYLMFFLFAMTSENNNSNFNYDTLKRFIYWISSLTYIIYLFHNWLINDIESYIRANFALNYFTYFAPKWLAIFLFFLFVITVSKFFEKPLIKLSKTFYKHKAP
jgi:peptidoglycan/LPS O-acetylase OafA/YrhL